MSKFTLFIPQEILIKSEEFYDMLYEKLEIREDMDLKFDVSKIEIQIDVLISKLEEIVDMMRKDIGVNIINRKLGNRLK